MSRVSVIALIVGAAILAAQVRATEFDAADAARLSAWRARVEQGRRDYESFAARARSRLARARRAESPAAARSTGYMSDETLRDGDVIVTERGLVVFTGEPRPRHGEGDFKTLDQWRGGLGYDRRLLEIERANASAAP